MKEPCGCCEGIEKVTPQSTANRPGLDTLSYRVGTHATFFETMQARLSDHSLEVVEDGTGKKRKVKPLLALTARSKDDPAIAMLDAWAMVADVLTFYQERIANEGFLRTAKERRSILELGRLVGYELRPGVAATVFLAFELEKQSDTEIPRGTAAQSIPEQGELPQVFETIEKIEARDEWNGLTARLTRPHYFTTDPNYPYNAARIPAIYFKGISTNLKPNDLLLLIFRGALIPRRIVEVEAQAKDDRTKVTLFTPAQQPGQTPVTFLSDAIKMVRAAVSRHLDLESFNVSPNTQMAKRVVGYLDRTQVELDGLHLVDIEVAEKTGGDLLAFVDEEIDPLLQFFKNDIGPRLRDDLREAEGRNYTVLKEWLRSLIEELIGGVRALAEAADVIRKESFESFLIVPAAEKSTTPANVLGKLLGPERLEKPPSLQPSSAQRLARDVDAVFGKTTAGGPPPTGEGPSEDVTTLTDATAQLLVAFNPRLKDSLYQAWANAEVTEGSQLATLHAFRVKAAPFGHNAPLKPIFNSDKVVEGYEEWPLDGSITIALILNLSERIDGKGEALITIKRDTDTQSGEFQLPPLGGSLPVTLSGITIKISVSEEPVSEQNKDFVFTFDFKEIGRVITIRVSTADVMRVSVAADGTAIIDKRPVPKGAVVKAAGKSDKITALRRGSDPMVALESLLPPRPFNVISLDAVYDQITPGSFVLIDRPDDTDPTRRRQIIAQVESVRSVTRADYGLSAKVTQLVLRTDWLTVRDTLLSVMRDTTVYAQSEALALAEEPITDDVCGDQIELAGLYNGLKPGRWMIVAGERSDIPGTKGVRAAELVMIAAVTQDVYRVTVDKDADGRDVREPLPGDKTHTFLQLANSLAYCYRRDTMILYGNVAKATHGETVKDVLGSGNAGRAMQTFALSRSPLTYVSAPTPAGTESTLEVRVNDVLWHETDSLAALGPNSRSYVTRKDEDDNTSVTFGNGKNGARLPTGADNVRASYRAGIGKAANVQAGRISQLASRPAGVKGVVNPLAATGGADREDRDQARRNVPVALTALDRLVSLSDYADFARTFAGIAKAAATRVSDGERQLVHLTIAGEDDIPIDLNSDLYRNLVRALHLSGDPHQPVRVDLRELVLLFISAKVRLMADYIWESVEPRIRARLLDTFSFEKRSLNQDVLLSEVVSAVQSVEGVYYVDVDTLLGIPEKVPDLVTGRPRTRSPEEITRIINQRKGLGPLSRVAVSLAGLGQGAIRPARIAYLTPAVPDTLILTELI